MHGSLTLGYGWPRYGGNTSSENSRSEDEGGVTHGHDGIWTGGGQIGGHHGGSLGGMYVASSHALSGMRGPGGGRRLRHSGEMGKRQHGGIRIYGSEDYRGTRIGRGGWRRRRREKRGKRRSLRQRSKGSTGDLGQN